MAGSGLDTDSLIAKLTADEVLATQLRNQKIQQGRGFFKNPDEDLDLDEEELEEIASAEAKKVAKEQREEVQLGRLRTHLARTRAAERAAVLLRAGLLLGFFAHGLSAGSSSAAAPAVAAFAGLHVSGSLAVALLLAPPPLSLEKEGSSLLRVVELVLRGKDAVGKLVQDTSLLLVALVLAAALLKVSGG